jgi:hypothetical protein
MTFQQRYKALGIFLESCYLALAEKRLDRLEAASRLTTDEEVPSNEELDDTSSSRKNMLLSGETSLFLSGGERRSHLLTERYSAANNRLLCRPY